MKYYVNTEARDDGTHVMHAETCQFLPNADKRKALGDYANCDTGLKHARDAFDTVTPCNTCCSDCSG
ncbi:hypothetical protein SAMN04488012_11536 [Palleronia salina]|uniref:Uncharacterized protein n=1 Tax=Palleronia salina TaxID=313368 RepID=A0A1M6LFA4_9RHOB|nr:hypothetical protein [Palleronia salina]SHJ69862.1 hypothetical protein SAMN04488012_11536 [Palleronia salina]